MSIQVSSLNRREALAAGAASAGLLIATRLRHPEDARAAAACATVTPAGEIGPYFVEEKLHRSDITTDSATGTAVAGVPLTLNWTLLDESNSCAAFSGVQVDVWHASPAGLYSDESVENTVGKTYLRGYQVSDANGGVTFKTVFPGWYSGRTPHIHVRFRTFDSSGTATYDFLTQIMFNESDIATVYAVAPYSSRPNRDTTNAGDHVYQAEDSAGDPAILAMTGNTTDGYVGTFTFGLVPSGSSTSTTTTTADTTVLAACSSAKITKTLLGARTLTLRLTTQEDTAVALKLRRGSKVLKSKKARSITAGTHTLKVALPKTLAAGRITIDMTFVDAAGNRKHIAKIRKVPALAA
jgi:protocatechuate 3,4-dioxygenase beta subunit